MAYIGKVPADVLIDPHVDSAAITDGTIITADIANDAVTSAKLAQNSVDSSELIDGSVDNSHLAGSIAMNKTNLTAGTGLTLSTDTLNVDAAQTQITSVGTIGTGVWQGTAIASAYLDADTAHLSGSTFTGDVYISASGSPSFRVTDTTNTVTGKFQADNTVGKVGTHTNHSFQLFSNNTTALTLDTSQNATFAGNVTIDGSGHPVLLVKGDASAGEDTHLQLHKSNGHGWTVYNSGTTLHFRSDTSSNDQVLQLKSDKSATFLGNVGIGKSSIDMAQTTRTALEIGAEGTLYSHSSSAQGNVTGIGHNYYYSSDGTPKFMRASEEAGTMEIYNGGFYFYSDSRTDQSADATASPTSKLTIQADGNVGIGGSPIGQLTVTDSATPEILLNDTGGTTNKRVFRISGGGDGIYFEGRNNDNSGAGGVGGDGGIMSLSLDDGQVTFFHDIELNGSGTRQIRFDDGNDSEGAIVFDETTDGFIFKVGGTPSSGKTDAVSIANSGITTFSNNIVLGSNKGIDFSASPNASASSELFDDYEEGTWTPTIVHQNPTGLTLSYDWQVGIYTKIGNVVHCRFSIRVDISGSPIFDNISIGGFPFTQQNATNSEGSTIADQIQITGKAGYRLSSSTNGTTAGIVLSSITGNQAQNIGVGNNLQFHGGISYFAA